MTARCPYFGKCGGCTAQHIDYSLQLENKKNALARAISFSDINVFSGKEYNYRNRMDFIFNPNGLGLREKGNWKSIVDIDNCVISDDKINFLLKEIKNFFKSVDSFDVKRHTGTFRYAVIRVADDTSISFVLNNESAKLAENIEKIREFTNKTTADNVVICYVKPETDMSVSDEFFAVKGNEFMKKTYLGKTFTYPIQGFFQNNHEMAEKMLDYVNNLLKNYDTKQAHLLDLYGGVGTFGIINAGLFKDVLIIESLKQSIDAANENIKINNIKNSKATVLDAMQLKKIDFQQPLFVITDPPRSGMHPKTILRLNELKPKAIIYISCNVEQLGKDIPKFKDYKINSAALFDLFPQTPHSEAIVELVLK